MCSDPATRSTFLNGCKGQGTVQKKLLNRRYTKARCPRVPHSLKECYQSTHQLMPTTTKGWLLTFPSMRTSSSLEYGDASIGSCSPWSETSDRPRIHLRVWLQLVRLHLQGIKGRRSNSCKFPQFKDSQSTECNQADRVE